MSRSHCPQFCCSDIRLNNDTAWTMYTRFLPRYVPLLCNASRTHSRTGGYSRCRDTTSWVSRSWFCSTNRCTTCSLWRSYRGQDARARARSQSCGRFHGRGARAARINEHFNWIRYTFCHIVGDAYQDMGCYYVELKFRAVIWNNILCLTDY